MDKQNLTNELRALEKELREQKGLLEIIRLFGQIVDGASASNVLNRINELQMELEIKNNSFYIT